MDSASTKILVLRALTLAGQFELILPDRLSLLSDYDKQQGKSELESSMSFINTIPISNDPDLHGTRIVMIFDVGGSYTQILRILLGVEAYDRLKQAHIDRDMDNETIWGISVNVQISSGEYEHIKKMIETDRIK